MISLRHLIDPVQCSIIETPSFILPFPTRAISPILQTSNLFGEIIFLNFRFRSMNFTFRSIRLHSIVLGSHPHRRDKLSRRKTRRSGSFEYPSFRRAFTLYFIWIITDFVLDGCWNEMQVFRNLGYIIAYKWLLIICRACQ